jgi:predicted ATPase/DNA-binding SARP family transcriptional activator
MRFGVLGPLAVWGEEGDPVRVPEAKVRALLADLLVHEGRVVSADRLVEDLWGGRPPGRPANALQAKVSQLRRAVGRDRVVHRPPGYLLRLDGPGDEVDADRFRRIAERAREAPEPDRRVALFTEALDLWRGPAYADLADEEFVRDAARRLAEERLTVLEERAEARLAAGDAGAAAGELAELVARHPLRERLRAAHLRALCLTGRQGEALASYEDLRRLLADELGVDPSPALAALHAAILRQDPDLTPRQAAPPAAAARRPATNLPAPVTPLIGRDAALDRAAGLLRTARLVTCTGPGGVGKTRLAVAVATRVAGEAAADCPDGVWFVELAGHRGGPDELAQAVADVLGVRDDAPAGPPGSAAAAVPPAAHLAAALRESRLLLVLDNCEHVVDAAADLVALLLRGAPGLRVLATSREALGTAGEAVCAVEPLAEADAVRLFAERAAAAAPGFTLDGASGETRAAVARVCRRLDGLPLALELAATRVRGLGVPELAARLGDRFRLLTAGRRGVPARQRTLRAVLDWSWDLLSGPERAVLRRLAVHRDGCGLDAAEAVCAGGEVPAPEVWDLMARLVDRSLVVVADTPHGPRYRLLETVAAYAVERLREAAEEAAVRERHLRFHRGLAERAAPHLRGPGQREWLARLDAEAGNLRAALATAVRRPSPAEAVRLASALTGWWLLRGRLHEGREALAAVLSVAPGAAAEAVAYRAFALLTGRRPPAGCPAPAIAGDGPRARALWLYAHGQYHAGDAAGEAVNEDALALAGAAGDRWATAAALALRAAYALLRGDLAGAERDGLRSAELFRELGDRWGEAQTVPTLASLAEIRGDHAAAARRQEEGLRIARELSLETEVAARLSGLGRLELLAGRWERARELHEEARRRAVAQGHLYGEVHALMGLALGARRSGDVAAAERYLLRLRDDYPSSAAGRHLLLAELGFVAEARGDAAGAADHHLRGLAVARSLGEPRAEALSLEGLAGAVLLAGGADGAGRAALLLGAADAARRSVGAPLPPAERGDVDRIAAAATAVLGGEAFAAAFRRGAALPPAEAAAAAGPAA